MNRAFLAVLAAAMTLAPAFAWAGTPSAGVAQEARSGFFADISPGAFFTATGTNSRGNKGVSNAQAYLQLGIGYDVLKIKGEEMFGLAIGLNFGLGSSAASCFANVTTNGDCIYDTSKKTSDPTNIAPDNFTVSQLGAEVLFKIKVYDRLFLRPRITVGYAFLDPLPIENLGLTFYAGVAFGIEYATRMDHFTIGIDLFDAKLIIGPNIPTFAIYPVIKYTF